MGNSCILFRRNYHSLRHMHVRGDRDSHQIVRQPLTTAQESNFQARICDISTVFSWLVEEGYAFEC